MDPADSEAICCSLQIHGRGLVEQEAGLQEGRRHGPRQNGVITQTCRFWTSFVCALIQVFQYAAPERTLFANPWTPHCRGSPPFAGRAHRVGPQGRPATGGGSRREGRCFYCGRLGHLIACSPVRPKHPGIRISTPVWFHSTSCTAILPLCFLHWPRTLRCRQPWRWYDDAKEPGRQLGGRCYVWAASTSPQWTTRGELHQSSRWDSVCGSPPKICRCGWNLANSLPGSLVLSRS
ncbi:uncharacterized protein LOC133493508 [Syngnathoides biaculeatus]|uniref:uncharacterized protein LOC133493508 n=1 Tax=Syngnathoides biaculeatus TaxID=300417 RepID=UPI002ADD4BAD|nr:uncharacterized protein LOC133493508 [Syngnathoides biaculeatus]